MKILQITSQPPSKYGGGGIGVIQTEKSLISENKKNIIDYVGPEIEDKELESLYDHIYYLPQSHNKLLRIWDSLCGNTNSRYRTWIKWARETDFSQYDAVVMDFTKLDYCLPYIRNIPLYVRVHNIEYDYARNDYKKSKSFSKLVIAAFSKKHEHKIVNAASKLVTLTEKDADRLIELYGNQYRKKIAIVPVCLDEPGEYHYKQPESTLKILITGSLWYGSNYQGVKWVLDEVVPKLDEKKLNYSLTIAGARPNNELIEQVKRNKNVNLIDTPEDMAPYFEGSDIVLIPVFDGAGMKVKVAEALSYGKCIIATPHALIGYSIYEGFNGYCADTAEDFSAKIFNYVKLNIEDKKKISEEAYKLFENKYSMENSRKLWDDILHA